LVNLGAMYLSMGSYSKIKKCFWEAKAIHEKALGKKHPAYILLLEKLGELYNSMGDNAKAEQYFLEAKTIQGKAQMN